MFRCGTKSRWEDATHGGNSNRARMSRALIIGIVRPMGFIRRVQLRRKRGTFTAVTCLRGDFSRSAGGRPCHGETSRNTPTSKNGKRHIEQSYESRGVPEKEAERRAWATVNKDDGGGKRAGGSGRGKSTGHPAAHKGGRIGGAASASRPPAPIGSGEKAAATRKRNAAHAAN